VRRCVRVMQRCACVQVRQVRSACGSRYQNALFFTNQRSMPAPPITVVRASSFAGYEPPMTANAKCRPSARDFRRAERCPQCHAFVRTDAPRSYAAASPPVAAFAAALIDVC